MRKMPNLPGGRLVLPLAIAIIVLSSATGVWAGTEALDGKVRSGDVVRIEADEIVQGDLYLTGATVFVAGTIEGDLVAASGDVSISGTVNGDVVLAGGRVSIGGDVTGDARVAGGEVVVSGSVGEDLAVAAGQVTVAASGSVGEDLVVGAGQLTLAGSVAGDVEGSVGAYSTTGTVGGSQQLTVDSPDPGSARDGLDEVLDAARHYIVVFLVGALALWLLPRLTRSAADTVTRRPLPSIGVGLIAISSVVVAAVVIVVAMLVASLVFTILQLGELVGLVIVGGIVALVVLAFGVYVVAGYAAAALVGLAIASFIPVERRSMWADLGLLAIGAALVVAVTSVPVLGGILSLVVVVLAVGALAISRRESWRAQGSASAPPLAPIGG